MTKQELRKTMIRIAKETPGPTPEAVADLICALPAYKSAKVVFGYIPLKSEVDVSAVMDRAVSDGKVIAFPAEEPGHFVIGDANWRDNLITLPNRIKTLVLNQFLNFGNEHDMLNEGVILVPGLAFTEFGTRLGRGAGYYDQTFQTITELAKRKKIADLTSLGICKCAQLVSELPTEPHDMTVDVVLSF